jgi:peroxiredoxin
MSLVESLIKIESQVHKGNVLENTKNFYKFVEIYEKEINNIFLILINNFYEIKNEMKSEINNEINFIATLNINFNEKIKNETEYMVLVVSMMIIKAFSNAKLVDSGDGKNNKYIYESDSIINSVLHDINFFFT